MYGHDSSAEPPDDLPVAYLYLEDGEDIFRVHLDRPRVLIGRAGDNDVVIRDQRIAAHHALIYFDKGRYLLTSASEGPVAVNGQDLDRARALFNGDVIDLQGTLLTFIKVPTVSDSVVQLGIQTGGEIPWFALINRPLVEIGSTRGDLLIADDFIGAPHCLIENFCAGAQYLVNVDEELGTLLNGRRVTRRMRLSDRDVVRIGATDLTIRIQRLRALPSPDSLIPLHDLDRARRRGGDEHADEAPLLDARPRRRIREILEEHERTEDPDLMFRLNDFEADDAEDKPYYLPEHRRAVAPSAMDSVLDEESRAGHTMLIPMDTKGKVKKDRYYLPETPEPARGGGGPGPTEPRQDEETRQDLPKVDPRRKR